MRFSPAPDATPHDPEPRHGRRLLSPALAGLTAAGLALSACSSSSTDEARRSGVTTPSSTTHSGAGTSTTGTGTTGTGTTGTGTTGTGTTGTGTDPVHACAVRTVERLTPAQRAGQLVMVGMDATAPTTALDATIAQHHVGNVIYLGGFEGASAVTSRSAHLQRQATQAATGGIPLLVAADQEGGEVQQIRGAGFERIPSASRQAQMTPAELTAAATAWATELKAVGVNVNLAPVADTVPTSVGRSNQPIGRWGRQYGSAPGQVAPPVRAFLAGMHAAGIEGVVMVSSAIYPKIDPSGTNAVFSKPVITDLLRGDLGYAGVVVTDDLHAASVRAIPAGQRATRHLAAGGDLVLTGLASEAPTMVAAITANAAREKAFADRVAESATRVVELKARRGLLSCG